MTAKKPTLLLSFLFAIIAIAGTWFFARDFPAPGKHPLQARGSGGEAPVGPHGGLVFTRDGLRVEVTIFEEGVPPRFRVYVSGPDGKKIDPKEVELTIELQRLDRKETIRFQPSGEYLASGRTVAEPHSFEEKISAVWKGRNYTWNYSHVELRAELSGQAIRNAGIELAVAGPGRIKKVHRFLAEIGLNKSRMTHIVPRLTGVVRKIFHGMGQPVRQGELLAVLDSRELADAKTQWYAAQKQLEMAAFDLQRQELIHKNTSLLMDWLDRETDLDALYVKLKDLDIGENREKLVTAYARLQLARTVFDREKRLFEKKISAEADYLLAREEDKSAQARYYSLREKIAFQVRRNLLEKQKAHQLAEIELKTSTQKLLSIGLPRDEIERTASQGEQDFTRHEIRAPMEGVVIQKHITVGEAVQRDATLFVLADLSHVRVNITIPEKELRFVRLGQTATVHSDQLGLEAAGTLSYIGSTMNEQTRSVTGRMVIPNPQHQWRPGLFVSVDLVEKIEDVSLTVPVEASQTVRGWPVVFVKYGNLFEPRPLKLGTSDGKWVEVLGGIAPGQTYVTKNSFAVKAEIEKDAAVHG